MKRGRARALRSNLTEAERRLWLALRRQALASLKFRRQVPLGPYIVDFCCLPLGMVVEADGGQHNDSAEDRVRDAWLRGEGFTVLRFWNNEIFENLSGVLQVIAATAEQLEAELQVRRGLGGEGLHPHPNPPPSRGRG